jgi:hypothetical protein
VGHDVKKSFLPSNNLRAVNIPDRRGLLPPLLKAWCGRVGLVSVAHHGAVRLHLPLTRPRPCMVSQKPGLAGAGAWVGWASARGQALLFTLLLQFTLLFAIFAITSTYQRTLSRKTEHGGEDVSATWRTG